MDEIRIRDEGEALEGDSITTAIDNKGRPIKPHHKAHNTILDARGVNVLVKPDTVEKMTSGGIILPDQVQEKERGAIETGLIIDRGSQAWIDKGTGEPWAAIGERVVFARYAGKKLRDPFTGEEFIVMPDIDIICVIRHDLEDIVKERA